jgi:pentatricopeptide repeat protein
MIWKRFKPNTVSYTILIAGLARLGNTDKAASLAEEMPKKGIELDHSIISLGIERKVQIFWSA